MSSPRFDAPPVLITTTAELSALVDTLLTFDRVAIDTESDGFYRYERRICLVQLTAGGVDYIVDPLKEGDLSPLAALLTSEAVEKVFHGGENDLTLFLDTLGVRLAAPWYDTYIAAQFAGEPQVGFGALVDQHFGFKLDKRFQLHDWGDRPLSPEAVAYARGDTHFLIPLRDKMAEAVAEKGREAHVAEELERLLEKVSPTAPFDPDACLRLKGTRGFKAAHYKVLRELFVMRDRLAREANVAPFRVLANQHLVDLSRSQPRTLDALNALPLAKDRGVRRHARSIVDAVEAGRQPDAPVPAHPQRGGGGPPAPEIEERLKALKAWRQRACEELGLSPGLVASNNVLGAVAEANPSDIEALSLVGEVRRWQIRDFGDAWLEALRRAG